jgi:hypothetical protein
MIKERLSVWSLIDTFCRDSRMLVENTGIKIFGCIGICRGNFCNFAEN